MLRGASLPPRCSPPDTSMCQIGTASWLMQVLEQHARAKACGMHRAQQTRLHAAVVEWAADKVVARVRQVELQLQALHRAPVPLALDGGLRRDQIAVPACHKSDEDRC